MGQVIEPSKFITFKEILVKCGTMYIHKRSSLPDPHSRRQGACLFDLFQHIIQLRFLGY